MTRSTVPPPCPKTDAVLALHLDGDIGEPHATSGFEFACGETLSSHLRECSVCQLALQRARRLDAALAEGAGRALASHAAADRGGLDHLAERWFAAVAAPDPAVAAPAGDGADRAAPRRLPAPAWPLWVLLAASLALAYVAAAPHSHAAPATPPPPVAEVPTPVPPAVPEPAAAPAGIVVADDAPRRLPRPRAAEALPRGRDVATQDDLLQQLGDAAEAPAERLLATRRLLGTARQPVSLPRGVALAFTEQLAALGDRDDASFALHRDLLALGRGSASFVACLHAGLQRLDTAERVSLVDLAVLTVAARLHVRELDEAIQRTLRRLPELAAPLAAAVRCGVRDGDTAALLLDCWDGLAVRGAMADDDAGARLWFGAQPAAVFDELLVELRTARAAPRRLRCILAMGCCGDGRTLAALLERLDAGSHDEACAAAFALSQLPRRHLQPLVATAGKDRERYLLRAALAWAGIAATAAWTDPLPIPIAEGAQFRSRSFAQFSTFVGWFRDRSLPAGD